MDELYPVKKARPWMLSGKENSKVHDLSDSIVDSFDFVKVL